MTFPTTGLVYDYMLDDAGISSPEMDEDEEDSAKNKEVKYWEICE